MMSLSADEIATLRSLEQLDDYPLYSMHYAGYTLLKAYRQDQETFSITYQQASKGRLSEQAETEFQ